jgi:RNA binding exosome subunit
MRNISEKGSTENQNKILYLVTFFLKNVTFIRNVEKKVVEPQGHNGQYNAHMRTACMTAKAINRHW